MLQPTSPADALSPTPEYEIIIEPTRGWLRVNWREFWEYRDLLVILVRRDFLSKYKQTLLGPAWFIAQPLLTALVMSIAFHRVAGVSTGGLPSLLFNLCALLPWTYFSQNVSSGGATFTANSHLFGKVYFPRLIVPVATVISNLYAFLLQASVFFAFFAWFKLRGAEIHLGAVSFLALPLILVTGILSLGVSLLIAASTARYRDLSHLTPVLLQLWMFVSPVFYRLEQLTRSETWAWLAWANPMSSLVEGFRVTLLGESASPQFPAMLAVSCVISAITLAAGIAAFQRAERTVVDTV